MKGNSDRYCRGKLEFLVKSGNDEGIVIDTKKLELYVVIKNYTWSQRCRCPCQCSGKHESLYKVFGNVDNCQNL